MMQTYPSGNPRVHISSPANEIEDAIHFQISHRRYEPCYIYGDGEAGKPIADILAEVDLNIDKCFFMAESKNK